jgi:hypothetical protein
MRSGSPPRRPLSRGPRQGWQRSGLPSRSARGTEGDSPIANGKPRDQLGGTPPARTAPSRPAGARTQLGWQRSRWPGPRRCWAGIRRHGIQAPRLDVDGDLAAGDGATTERDVGELGLALEHDGVQGIGKVPAVSRSLSEKTT